MPGNSTSFFIAQRFADEVISLWEFAPIPTTSISTINKKVQPLVDMYHKASKVPTNKREKDPDNTEISTYDSLFDVKTCKCCEFSIDRKDCSCLMKVPLYE